MVNDNLPMNHQQSGAFPMMITIKNGSASIPLCNNNHHGTPTSQSGHSGQKQEDEILEVNLIGVNSNGAPDNVLGDFSEFLDTGQLSDMTMRCGDGRFIECHRLVLAARANNLRHFICGRNHLITELVFRNCVKFEHLQALVNLIYRGQINGGDHQITSTLWKLFKIFGVRVTAKCYKNNPNGHKELAHQLKYESVERDVVRGAQKFEKIVREFRSETRRKVRRRASGDASPLMTKKNKKKSTPRRPPGVIVISDDEQGEWSSASCSSSVSSLSSSSSEGDGDVDLDPPQQQPRVNNTAKQQNGKSKTAAKLNMNSNSAMKAPRNDRMIRDSVPPLIIQEVKSEHPMATGDGEDWDSSGSSEGEYVEAEAPPKKQKTVNKNNRQPPAAVIDAPSCLEYNQNEMSIIVKSVPENNKDMLHNLGLRPNSTLLSPKQAVNPVKDTESEAIICSPQILFNIKPEPIDEYDEHEVMIDDHFDIDSIKMEIVEEENFDQSILSHDRNGRKMPPPLLIPLQTVNRQQRRNTPAGPEDSKQDNYVRDGNLEQFINECKPDCKRPANFPPFILRNPRGNQTRTYTTDNLWAALMDVKSGESIYRASQQHKVPRKTLRNWMKRCQIKSAYPMPSQLKEAAEKKKLQKYCYQ